MVLVVWFCVFVARCFVMFDCLIVLAYLVCLYTFNCWCKVLLACWVFECVRVCWVLDVLLVVDFLLFGFWFGCYI